VLDVFRISYTHDRGAVIMIANQILEGIKMSLPENFDLRSVVAWMFKRLGTGASILIIGFMYFQEEQKNAQQISNMQIEIEILTSIVTEVKKSNERLEASLYKMEYMPSYEIIKLGLAGLSHEEAINKIKFWVDNEWVAKIANLKTLCEEPGRVLLITITGNSARAGDYCRAAHF
jgi:hypothetical protein